MPPSDYLIHSLERLTRRYLRLFAGGLFLVMVALLAFTLVRGGPLFSEVTFAVIATASAIAVSIWRQSTR